MILPSNPVRDAHLGDTLVVAKESKAHKRRVAAA